MIKSKFKIYKNNTGSLVPFSLKNDIPFNVKRIFLIYGKKNFIRGNHAHKKCSQFVFPVLGKIRIDCISKRGKEKIILDFKRKEGYLLKPKTWCKIKFLTKNAVLLVACDMEYEFKDYIESYKEFLKIIKKRKI